MGIVGSIRSCEMELITKVLCFENSIASINIYKAICG